VVELAISFTASIAFSIRDLSSSSSSMAPSSESEGQYSSFGARRIRGGQRVRPSHRKSHPDGGKHGQGGQCGRARYNTPKEMLTAANAEVRAGSQACRRPPTR